MKQLFLVTLCISLLSTLLVSCGQSSPSANAFISTDTTTIMLLQWKQGDNNQISGQWDRIHYSLPSTPYMQASQPEVYTVPITGTLDSGNITIQSSGVTLFTGTQKDDSLDLNGVNSQGQAQTTHWYASDQSTYNQLVKLFEAHMSTRVRIAILDNTLNLLPVDSDPATAAAKV